VRPRASGAQELVFCAGFVPIGNIRDHSRPDKRPPKGPHAKKQNQGWGLRPGSKRDFAFNPGGLGRDGGGQQRLLAATEKAARQALRIDFDGSH